MDGPEPLCSRCVESKGLCRIHAKGILPQLAQPGWVRLIGVQAKLTKAPKLSHAAALIAARKARKAERRQARLHAARQAELAQLREILHPAHAA